MRDYNILNVGYDEGEERSFIINNLNAISASIKSIISQARVNDSSITTGTEKNASDIATNTANIATNTANISSNDSDISALDGRVTTNEGNISTNAAGIATNSSNISTNAGNIATNVGNIATNTSNIATNASGISALDSRVSTNETDISTNASNITSNYNSLDARITSNDGDISTNASNISTNTSNIATNASNISTNTTAISGVSGNSSFSFLGKYRTSFSSPTNGEVTIDTTSGIDFKVYRYLYNGQTPDFSGVTSIEITKPSAAFVTKFYGVTSHAFASNIHTYSVSLGTGSSASNFSDGDQVLIIFHWN